MRGPGPRCLLHWPSNSTPPRTLLNGIYPKNFRNGVSSAYPETTKLSVPPTTQSLALRQVGMQRLSGWVAVLTLVDICDLSNPGCQRLQYTGLVDRNAHQRNRPANHVHVNFYGRVETFFSVPLPAIAELELDKPFKVVVAAIRKAKTSLKTPLRIPYYSEMGGMEIVDISVIKCLVGRIEDRGEWAIVDRTAGLAQADFS